VNFIKTNWFGTHHLYGIDHEITMEFRQEYSTFMASLLDHSFEHANLICEILLLAENVSRAAIIILERTESDRLENILLKVFDIEASFFQ
jgi:hypothetical protein